MYISGQAAVVDQIPNHMNPMVMDVSEMPKVTESETIYASYVDVISTLFINIYKPI